MKFDTEKDRWDLLPWRAVREVVRVVTYGAKKYTVYGECTCSAASVSDLLRREGCAEPATTSGSSVPIPRTRNGSAPKVRSGNERTANIAAVTTENFPSNKQPKGTESRSKKSSNCSHVGAKSADGPTRFASTTTTRPELYADACASRVTSASGGLSKANGLREHAPTCDARKILRSGENNWRGVESSRYVSALHRHLYAWMDGETHDSESGLHHLAHAGCNILFLLTFALEKEKSP